MDNLEILISIVAAIGLFTHSLESFSKNLRGRANEKIKNVLGRFTDSKIRAIFIGFTATAVIQSSSAVVAIVISFVDSGIILFHNALPVLLGSNLGTTLTAWLVSFKVDTIGIVLLALGFVLGYFKGKMGMIGKPIFYLGLILFSLELISEQLGPIKESEELIHYLSFASNPIIGVLLGAVITAICQSSSVTIGLSIILCGQGFLELDSAIAIMVGSNIGTTSTAFIAAMNLSLVAKRTALANLVFNGIGLLIFLPFSKLFVSLIQMINVGITFQVAYAHLIFNLIITIVILPFTKPIGNLIEKKVN
ncbi:Na/Pi cotransporter family protein [Hanstruepera ponticola]|uniref:Na/Pi cotransporter family protein n=1 Tax=Hanstruepera ponticola TaxID=2042995 RepID=UPI000CF0348E|nr:Na/Pi symporter [Hanstruepera ponticola]